MPDHAPQRDAILTALERLLAWPEIARSPQLARFLDYIVRKTLDGDEQSIKAYAIAVDVLGRSTDFDPQADPIVRVQARRLRGLLDEYYRGPGAEEELRIILPVGRYVPEFVSFRPDHVEETSAAVETSAGSPAFRQRAAGGLMLSWFVLAVITLGLAVAAFAFSTWGPKESDVVAPPVALQRPSVTIVEFQNLAEQPSGGPTVAGLAIELVTDLEQFENIDVRYGGGGDGNIAMSGLPTSDYVLTGIVRRDGPSVQYSAILTSSVSGGVVWNHSVSIAAETAVDPGVLDAVSRQLSLILGSPRGPLHAAARQMLVGGALIDGGVNFYLCRMLFDLYRQTDAVSDARRTSDCVGALPEDERQSSMGLAILGSLTAEHDIATAIAGTAVSSAADRARLAEASLNRAIILSPVSGFVWEQHARLREGMGALKAALTDYGSSIQLNPANADALAAYARLLAFQGRLAEAEPMAMAAMTTPNPPAWYWGVPVLLDLRDGRFAEAIVDAERYAESDRELGPILAILAAQGARDSAVVNRYLPEVLDVASFRDRGVLTRLRERIADDDLLDAIRDSLVAAGMPPGVLADPY